MPRHANISLFVPHEGCPYRCSFCDQRTISGHSGRIGAADVEDAVRTAIRSGADPEETEIAFFGGSFTAIPRGHMLELLEAAAPFVRSGAVRGIRCSTRPDAVDGEVLSVLKSYGVTAVELGAQSMSDRVLLMNRRGHTAADVEHASELIKAAGLELGLQMMTGLYGDDDETCIGTARSLIALAPATVRIYPTVVIEGTELASLLEKGEYKAQTVDEAAALCAVLLPMFESAGIRVIRLGLHSGGGVGGRYVAGAYHPAFGELVESKIMLDRTARYLRENNITGNVTVYVNPSSVSKMTGQRRRNIEELRKLGINAAVRPDPGVAGRDFRIEQECI